MSIADAVFNIYQYVVIPIVAAGIMYAIYCIGKTISHRYNVAKWYFWTVYLLAVPVIATPAVFFVSLFMDHVKHDNYAIIAWIMINTWAIWFIWGFKKSMKLYNKMPCYLSILPSILSWVLAILAICGGLYLVNH